MAGISAPPSSFSAVASSSPFARPASPSLCMLSRRRCRLSLLRLVVSSRVYFSKSSSGSNGSREGDSSSSNGGSDELHPALRQPPSWSAKNPAVFVTLPADAVGPSGKMTRKKAMRVSFMALKTAGVEGVSVECWWGIVESAAPGMYDWGGYMDLVTMARHYGLKVRAIMAFHQWGDGPSDPGWWGRRNKEYISLGCDVLPVLRGRSLIQVYSDFMRSFRDTFKEFLGVVVTEIQVGMGPAGELRYPSCSTQNLQANDVAELGEFQCYDKYMQASLNACAEYVGHHEWGYGCPLGDGDMRQNPEETTFSRNDGTWKRPYGRFFLEWYSGLLLLHGQRLCMVTDEIFGHTGVKISAKVAGVHWHYITESHPSELTAGYYNTITRDGYLPIARMLGKHRMALCCTCFDKRDSEERINPRSSPEGFLRQLLLAARICELPLIGENSFARLDEASLDQVVKNSKLYYDGGYKAPLSFNYVRMSRNLFDPRNWIPFTRFVKKMSDSQTFRARLDPRGSEALVSSIFAAKEVRRTLVYH